MTAVDPTRGSDPGLSAGPDGEPSAPAHPLEIALRSGTRYSGLREVEPDSRLLLYVPLEICERETVVPLCVNEECLHVATASPEPNLELVRERFPDLEIEIVLAPLQRIADLHDQLKAVL